MHAKKSAPDATHDPITDDRFRAGGGAMWRKRIVAIRNIGVVAVTGLGASIDDQLAARETPVGLAICAVLACKPRYNPGSRRHIGQRT